MGKAVDNRVGRRHEVADIELLAVLGGCGSHCGEWPTI
jgi:hypothetical protein